MEFCVGIFKVPFASPVHGRLLFKRCIKRMYKQDKTGNTNRIICSFLEETKRDIFFIPFLCNTKTLVNCANGRLTVSET